MSMMHTEPRVLLLCGGQSEEHEVSLASARSVISATQGQLAVTPVVIDRSGRLLDQAASLRALDAGQAPAGSGSTELAGLNIDGGFDAVFPLLHGPNGEDGSIQGMLKLAGIPFVGSDVLGSAVGMDKLMMKAVLKSAGFSQVDYRGVTRSEWRSRRQAVLAGMDLPLPVFVKPANLGSSVGISRVTSTAGLEEALDLAFTHDRRVIIEAAVDRPRELEVGVLGNDEPRASVVGEITYSSDFYDYDTKYVAGQAGLQIPAEIDPELNEKCRNLAVQAFTALDLAGLARVDFFLTDSGALLVNEVNTMPGFTVTSMYPRLFAASGVDYATLVRELVRLALERSGVQEPGR